VRRRGSARLGERRDSAEQPGSIHNPFAVDWQERFRIRRLEGLDGTLRSDGGRVVDRCAAVAGDGRRAQRPPVVDDRRSSMASSSSCAWTRPAAISRRAMANGCHINRGGAKKGFWLPILGPLAAKSPQLPQPLPLIDSSVSRPPPVRRGWKIGARIRHRPFSSRIEPQDQRRRPVARPVIGQYGGRPWSKPSNSGAISSPTAAGD